MKGRIKWNKNYQFYPLVQIQLKGNEKKLDFSKET
jgi:hypothetical protein